MSSMTPSSPTTPAIASRRAGPASSGGANNAVAAPADADALAPNSQGSSCRASCQTGIAVFASNVPVYVVRGGPVTNDVTSAAHFTGRSFPTSSSTAAVLDAPLDTNSTHEPTLIGDVTLKTGRMFRKRSARP